MLNSTVLTGHLGEDPKISYTGDGKPVANFSFAFHSSVKKENDASWVKVVCFNKLAEIAQNYLHKGAKVSIIGILEQNRWTNDQGEKKSNYQIIANSIEFIKTDGRGFEGNQSQDDVPF